MVIVRTALVTAPVELLTRVRTFTTCPTVKGPNVVPLAEAVTVCSISSIGAPDSQLTFWLEGEPFEGYVLRAELSNYAISYQSDDDQGPIDTGFTHVERHFIGRFGSYSRWGVFTLGGELGLGVELNKETRCPAGIQCEDNEMVLLIDRNNNAADINGPLHPVILTFSLSLGFIID